MSYILIKINIRYVSLLVYDEPTFHTGKKYL
jgi:hypothetical protein